jgi:SEFIR domain.
MQEDKIPKIFISYSWSSDDLVMRLAERLRSQGVDVVLDKWELKEGQDKYVFMEQCVNDFAIDKVLIVCDKQYAEKANLRKGGVGDETAIISSEIYGQTKQEKFIPIICECDEAGNPYVPTYIGTRIYIDLSDENMYEENYEKLLRNIYEKPTYRKPKLGKKPEWIDDHKISFFPLQDLIQQMKGSQNSRKQIVLAKDFIGKYIEILKTYYDKECQNGEQVFQTFTEMKTIREYFLDYLGALKYVDVDYADLLCGLFEKMYNQLTYIKTFEQNTYSCGEYAIDIYKIHIWELFIYTIVFYRYNEDYKTINKLLTNTYFLIESSYGKDVKPTNYLKLRHSSHYVEEYKLTTKDKQKFTLLGNSICSEREKLPIYTKESIAQADLFLYQVFNALDVSADEISGRNYWFPTCYIYVEGGINEWQKLKSRKFCEKMIELFGVNNVQELKERIGKCEYNSRIKYSGSVDVAPTILESIRIEEIGTLN